jgi:hypothetical protein
MHISTAANNFRMKFCRGTIQNNLYATILLGKGLAKSSFKTYLSEDCGLVGVA